MDILTHASSFQPLFGQTASWEELPALLHAFTSHAHDAGMRPVVLCATPDETLLVRKAVAKAGCGFGVTIDTLSQWVSDQWTLRKTHTSLVTTTQRQAFLTQALIEKELTPTPGMLSCAQTILKHASFDALKRYPLETSSMDSPEKTLVEALFRYRDILSFHRLTEYAQALSELPPLVVPYHHIALVGKALHDISAAEQTFLDQAHALTLDVTVSDASANNQDREIHKLIASLEDRQSTHPPIIPTGALTLKLASGPEAHPRALHDALKSALDNTIHPHDIKPSSGCSDRDFDRHAMVVVTPHPFEQFQFSASLLQQSNITCAVEDVVPFTDTDAGRALIDACNLVTREHAEVALACDYSFNPYAGMWFGTAFYSDKIHRGNRLIDKDDLLLDLAGHAHEELQGVIGLLEEDNLEEALNVLETYTYHYLAHDEGYAEVQISALRKARAIAETAHRAHLSATEHLLRVSPSISLRLQTSPHSDEDPVATVRFMTLEKAAALKRASVDALILGSLTLSAYPASTKETSAHTLLKKCGVTISTQAGERMRAQLIASLGAARHLVVLERTLNTSTGDEEQPALFLNDIMECYRNQKNPQDLKRHGVAEALLSAYTTFIDEQEVLHNVTGLEDQPGVVLHKPPEGTISSRARDLVVLPRIYPGKRQFSGLDLSASQIESYLECPYQWFAKRRLKLESIDEAFDIASRGTFMHSVLQVFFKRFQTCGHQRITQENLAEAQSLLRSTFEYLLKLQPEVQKGMRWVAIDAWEEHQQQDLLKHLIDYLNFEIRLLPSFEPHYFEWSFGADEPFAYAGCNLCGCIDRIDIDAQGNAIIIDYKSSLSNAYRLHGTKEDDQPAFVLPRKVQALMYAQAVRKLLGYRVVGALFINPIKQDIKGAWDAQAVGPEQIPFSSAEAKAGRIPWANIQNFDDLLDTTETLIKERLLALRDGDIAPNPSGNEACEWCPVVQCSKRLTKRK